MSKQADERASEKGDDRTNEKAERYVWRAFRDIAHHVFGLHIAARHTAQCSHAACTIQRAWRRAVAREWGMPSLLDSKDALGAPWLGLEHAYHNSQCRQNDRRLHYNNETPLCSFPNRVASESAVSIILISWDRPCGMLTPLSHEHE